MANEDSLQRKAIIVLILLITINIKIMTILTIIIVIIMINNVASFNKCEEITLLTSIQ